MNNDKIFAAYALTLLAGVASVITASVLAGFATLPSPLVFAEHLAMSLGFRAAYKSFGGFDWITSWMPAAETAVATEAATVSNLRTREGKLEKAA